MPNNYVMKYSTKLEMLKVWPKEIAKKSKTRANTSSVAQEVDSKYKFRPKRYKRNFEKTTVYRVTEWPKQKMEKVQRDLPSIRNCWKLGRRILRTNSSKLIKF